MNYREASLGRTFVLRLEQGEIIHETVEKFAKEKNVQRGVVWVIGGADEKSRLVTGPQDPKSDPVSPTMPLHTHMLDGVHESAGVGTLFPDTAGEPVLHLHLACGRENGSVTGCARNGVIVWLYMEVVILELTGIDAVRAPDTKNGFNLLNFRKPLEKSS